MKKLALLLSLLMITAVKAEEIYSVLFVLDISGSMSGAPLRNVKGVIDKGLAKMPAGSYGGLISFHGCGDSTVKLEVPVSENPHRAIQQKAHALQAQGATDLVLALKKAEVEAKRLPSICTNVIVLTDGFDTCNDETAEEVAGRIASVNTCNEVNVVSMGLVENWEKSVLDDVGKAGRGKHKAKKDSTEVVEEVTAIIDGFMGDQGGHSGWTGDYKDPNNGNGTGGNGNNPPPPGGDKKKKKKEEQKAAAAGGSSGTKGKKGK